MSDCIAVNCLTFYVIYLQEYLPENGYNKWPKHVAGYTVYNTINLHICICTCWFIYFRSSLRINISAYYDLDILRHT
jgi:hypothetical protein